MTNAPASQARVEWAHEAAFTATLTVPNRLESIRPAVSFLVYAARALNVPAASATLFEVAVSEALTNAVKHGHPGQEDATIVCDIEVSERQLTMRIIDGGRGFSVPERRVPPIAAFRIEELPEAGYGLRIMQAVFPIVRAIRVDGQFGVELEMPL